MRPAYGAILLALALAAEGAPVAFVADVRGAATIEGDGNLTFLTELSPGTRVNLGSHSTAAITYAASGTEFKLAGPGTFLVSADEVTAERGAKPGRRSVSVLSDASVVSRAAQTATASLRMRGIVPSGAATSALEFPVSTRIATLKPSLRWRAEPGEQYTLVLLDSTGREVWKGGGKTGVASVGVPLAADNRYTWNVASTRGSLGEAQFETLGSEAIRRAERSRSGRSFADRVVNALLLQEIGAQQEARDAWAELARERPDLPELPALAR